MSPKEPNAPIRYTPLDWRRVGIEPQGKKFRIVWQASRLVIFGSDLKCAGLEPDLKTDKLTLPEAVKTGAVIDAAFVRLLNGKEKSKKI